MSLLRDWLPEWSVIESLRKIWLNNDVIISKVVNLVNKQTQIHTHQHPITNITNLITNTHLQFTFSDRNGHWARPFNHVKISSSTNAPQCFIYCQWVFPNSMFRPNLIPLMPIYGDACGSVIVFSWFVKWGLRQCFVRLKEPLWFPY